MTLAPTIPVVAARSAPTKTVLIATPPRIPPNKNAIDSRSLSAKRVFCEIIPIKIKSGTEIKILFSIILKILYGINEKRSIIFEKASAKISVLLSSKACTKAYIAPKNTAIAPNVKATGNPIISIKSAAKNITIPTILYAFRAILRIYKKLCKACFFDLN